MMSLLATKNQKQENARMSSNPKNNPLADTSKIFL